MVGKCIRKKDQYELDYMMRVQKQFLSFILTVKLDYSLVIRKNLRLNSNLKTH